MTDTGGPAEPMHLQRERNFAANLKAKREELGLTQEDVAERMRALGFPFHQATVYRIETGGRKLLWSEADALAAMLGTHPASLSRAPVLQRLLGTLNHHRTAVTDAFYRVDTATTTLLAAQDDLRAVYERLQQKSPDEAAALADNVNYDLALTPEQAVTYGRRRYDSDAAAERGRDEHWQQAQPAQESHEVAQEDQDFDLRSKSEQEAQQ